MPGRCVADIANDTAAVLDAVGAESFVTIGWSGGGPHALACAALLPERCRAAVTLAGVAPYDAEGLDWLAGMSDENVEEFTAALDGNEPLTRFLDAQATVLANVAGTDVADSLGGLVSAVDKAALTGEFAEYLAAVFRQRCRLALRAGEKTTWPSRTTRSTGSDGAVRAWRMAGRERAGRSRTSVPERRSSLARSHPHR
jgi:pimeloyl-ACP methyl ester carboxylesterase